MSGRPRHLAPTPLQEAMIEHIICNRETATIRELAVKFGMVATQVRYHLYRCRDQHWIPASVVQAVVDRSFRKTPKLAEARKETLTSDRPDPRIEIADKISKLLREDVHAQMRLAQLMPNYVASTPLRRHLNAAPYGVADVRI